MHRCQSCTEACPYDVIDFDEGEDIAWKCNLSNSRTGSGLIQACADKICVAHCIYFGDPEGVKQKIGKGA